MARELREAVRGSGSASGVQRKPGTIKTREGTTRDPQFEKAHPRAPEGRTGGGRFITAGSKGPAAQAVREKLGNLSDDRIKRFQKRRGLVVDGKIGHQTAAALAGEKNAAKVKIGKLTDEDRRKLRKLKVEEAFDPQQPRDRYGRWKPTRATYLQKEREALKRGWDEVAARMRADLDRHKAERAGRAEERQQRRASAGRAMERALASGSPLPWHVGHMVEGRAAVAWQAALDAHEGGNLELALQHAETALRLEMVEAGFRPEQLRDKWGKWRTELRQRTLEMERGATRRVRGAKARARMTRSPLWIGPEAPPLGAQLLLLEAVPADIHFDPRRHPRNRVGEFIEVLNKLTANQTVELPGGTNVTKRVMHGERTGTPYTTFDIRRPGVKRPWKRGGAQAAAAAADVVAEEIPELKQEGQPVTGGRAKPRPGAPQAAKDYLAEPIMYGGEVKTRGEVIAALQGEGHRQQLIDRYMQGAKTLTPPEEPPPPMTPAQRMNEPEAALARQEGAREVGVSAEELKRASARAAKPKTSKGIYYFPSREAALARAEQEGWPTDRIIEYERGWAVQSGKSGGYAGPEGAGKPFTGAKDPSWRVYVRGEPFTVTARDIDAARTEGMQRAMRERGWKLRDVFVATPSDQITRLSGGAEAPAAKAPAAKAPAAPDLSSRRPSAVRVGLSGREGKPVVSASGEWHGTPYWTMRQPFPKRLKSKPTNANLDRVAEGAQEKLALANPVQFGPVTAEGPGQSEIVRPQADVDAPGSKGGRIVANADFIAHVQNKLPGGAWYSSSSGGQFLYVRDGRVDAIVMGLREAGGGPAAGTPPVAAPTREERRERSLSDRLKRLQNLRKQYEGGYLPPRDVTSLKAIHKQAVKHNVESVVSAVNLELKDVERANEQKKERDRQQAEQRKQAAAAKRKAAAAKRAKVRSMSPEQVRERNRMSQRDINIESRVRQGMSRKEAEERQNEAELFERRKARERKAREEIERREQEKRQAALPEQQRGPHEPIVNEIISVAGQIDLARSGYTTQALLRARNAADDDTRAAIERALRQRSEGVSYRSELNLPTARPPAQLPAQSTGAGQALQDFLNFQQDLEAVQHALRALPEISKPPSEVHAQRAREVEARPPRGRGYGPREGVVRLETPSRYDADALRRQIARGMEAAERHIPDTQLKNLKSYGSGYHESVLKSARSDLLKAVKKAKGKRSKRRQERLALAEAAIAAERRGALARANGDLMLAEQYESFVKAVSAELELSEGLSERERHAALRRELSEGRARPTKALVGA